MTHEKLCFVISPIGDADSETRKRSDQVLNYVVRPAVTSCGYKAVRADEIDKPGMITSQVIRHVVNDDLVVADLTERNPNVFYELAIRHALRKPLVQIIGKGEAIPFDVAGTRTIYVDHKDLDSVAAAKNEIIKQVKALEKDSSDIETPISVLLDLQLRRQSEKPEERSLAKEDPTLAKIEGIYWSGNRFYTVRLIHISDGLYIVRAADWDGAGKFDGKSYVGFYQYKWVDDAPQPSTWGGTWGLHQAILNTENGSLKQDMIELDDEGNVVKTLPGGTWQRAIQAENDG